MSVNKAAKFSAADHGLFVVKQSLLRLKRTLNNLGAEPRLKVSAPPESARELARSESNLWTSEDQSELAMQLGKVQNLRVVGRALNGLYLPAGTTFSFWRQVGKPTSRRGFVKGRELRSGCLIPTVAGGICQLSNAMYDLADRLGFEIVERHAHSQVVPGSDVQTNRDATLAWNYIDLRFKPNIDVWLDIQITKDKQVIRFLGVDPKRVETKPKPIGLRVLQMANSCVSCGQDECFHHQPDHQSVKVKTAFLGNAATPEFKTYLKSSNFDSVYLPIDGARFKQSNYDWAAPNSKFQTKAVLARTLKNRISPPKTPPETRHRSLENDRLLAEAYAELLKFDETHIVVPQSLLPFLWESGCLGGRTFDVLLERLPLAELHRRLDEALAKFPEQKLLGDFRADPKLVEAESKSLERAAKVITAHRGFASLFPGKSILLDWSLPKATSNREGTHLVFVGPTAARKGAFAVREAAKQLNLPVIVLGRNLESPEFWNSLDVKQMSPADPEWLNLAKVVVQPSISEDRPNALLKAFAAGLPIVATNMCGLAESDRVAFVDFGDSDALLREVQRLGQVQQ